MAFRLSIAADQDVRDIHTFGALSFGERQADSYVKALIKGFEFIGANPKAGRERREISPPVRVHVVGSHLIIYLIEERGAHIVRIMHGHADWQTELSEKKQQS
jgi:toxin ParE1/3/4